MFDLALSVPEDWTIYIVLRRFPQEFAIFSTISNSFCRLFLGATYKYFISSSASIGELQANYKAQELEEWILVILQFYLICGI